MKGMKGLKIGAVLSLVISMLVLLGGGFLAKKQVAPYPEKVSVDGMVLVSGRDILDGQDVYQKYGLMDHGSVWGHGTYRGMDFSATTLHWLGDHMRDYFAREKGASYESFSTEDRAAIDAKVVSLIKTNTYDPATKTLALTPAHAYAYGKIREAWTAVFRGGDKSYGFLPDTVRSDDEAAKLSAFFFWTAWVASTDRPGKTYTYTNNWPPDKSVGNTLSPHAFLWSVLAIVGLFVVLGFIIYVVHRYRYFYGESKSVEAGRRLLDLPLTSSQVKAAKFFLVVILLFVLQTLMGGLMAHYTVHPGRFFFDFVAKNIPYSWAKTWHLQLAIFWIATTWIGTSIYLAPLISKREPKGQGLLVNLLFSAVVLVAVGSLAGEVLGIKGLLGSKWFWFGHQGWEYLELGRAWQVLLFAGLIAWLLIVYRALKGRLFGPERDTSGLVWFYTLSAILVVGFFCFGLFYGRGTHLTVADYWRWFVVHIWVEGMFEFFGVAVIALFLVTLGLVDKASAMKVAYLTAILVFAGGIIGTAHHYFWYGGPAFWLALGAVFSSLEPIPLILLVVRAWMEFRSVRAAGGDFPYRWPLYFLVASSFWNFLGAGVFGFTINLPLVNYYEHSTYLTANHAHTALFGVYGMLSIALLLFTWRSLVRKEHWNDRVLKVSFFGLNAGLCLMFLVTLLPMGLAQVSASYTHGLWFARSNAFYDGKLVQVLGLVRAIPDGVIIVFGALPLLYFLLKTYPKLKKVGCKPGEDIYQGKDCLL